MNHTMIIPVLAVIVGLVFLTVVAITQWKHLHMDCEKEGGSIQGEVEFDDCY